jgi:hypothetical protein
MDGTSPNSLNRNQGEGPHDLDLLRVLLVPIRESTDNNAPMIEHCHVRPACLRSTPELSRGLSQSNLLRFRLLSDAHFVAVPVVEPRCGVDSWLAIYRAISSLPP